MSLDRRTPVLRSFDHVIPVLEAWRDLCVRRCERRGGARLLCKCNGGLQATWQPALSPHGLEQPAFPGYSKLIHSAEISGNTVRTPSSA